MIRLSDYGRINLVIIAVIQLILSANVAFTTWWQVYFTDCHAIDDSYFYLLFKKGLCYDNSAGTTDDWSQCSSWDDVADNTSGSASDSAEAFEHAYGLATTIFVLIAIQFVLSLLNFITPQQFDMPFRLLQSGLYGLCFVFTVATFGTMNNNYYYKADNYGGIYDDCDTTASFLGGAYACGLLLVLFTFGSAISVIVPCCCCAAPDDAPLIGGAPPAQATAVHATNTSSSGNTGTPSAPVAPATSTAVMSPVVAYAEPVHEK